MELSGFLSLDSACGAQRKRPTVRNHLASILLRPRLCARNPEAIPTKVILTKPKLCLCTCVQPLWNRWSRAAFKVWTAATGRSVSDQQFETIRLAYSYDRDYALDMLTRYLPKSFTPNRNSVYALAYSLFGIDGAERLSKFGQRLRRGVKRVNSTRVEPHWRQPLDISTPTKFTCFRNNFSSVNITSQHRQRAPFGVFKVFIYSL